MIKTKPTAVVWLWFLIVCKDDYRDCGTWLRSGMCQLSEYRQFITNGCAKTCGLCTDGVLTPPIQRLQDLAGPAQPQQVLQQPGRYFPQLPQDYFLQTNAKRPLLLQKALPPEGYSLQTNTKHFPSSQQVLLPPKGYSVQKNAKRPVSPQVLLPPKGYSLQTNAKHINSSQVPHIHKGYPLQTNAKRPDSPQQVLLPSEGFSIQKNAKHINSPQLPRIPKGYSLPTNAQRPVSPQQVLQPLKGHSPQTNAKQLYSPKQKQALRERNGRKFKQIMMRIQRLKNLPSKFAFSGQRMADNNTANSTSNTTSPAEQSNCTDIFLKCDKWKAENLCQGLELKEYLRYGCAKTCRFCNCRDTYRESPYCADWKEKGFCTTYPNQMDNYCPKTCLLCGDSIAPPIGGKTVKPGSSMALAGAVQRGTAVIAGGMAHSGTAVIGGTEKPVEQNPIEGDPQNSSLEGTQVLKGGQNQQQPGTIIIRDSTKADPAKANGYLLPSLDLSRKKEEPSIWQGASPYLYKFKRDDTDDFVLDDGFNDGNVPLNFQNFQEKGDSNFVSKDPASNASYVQPVEEEVNHEDGFSELGILGKPTAQVSEDDNSKKVDYGDTTFLTPARKPPGLGNRSDYYTENYSKDPDVAASQQMEEMEKMANTGEKFVYSRSFFHYNGKPHPKLLRTKDDKAAKYHSRLHHRKKNRKVSDKQ